MEQKSIQTNAIYNVIKSAAAVIFPLITFPYASRVLLADGIGKVNFSLSVVSYFTLISSLGLTTYAIRECAGARNDKDKLGRVASELFSINMMTTLIAYVLLGLTLLFAKPLQEYRTLIIIQSSAILFTTLGTDWLNSAMEDFRYITLRTVGFQILSLALLFAFVRTPDDYIKYAIITVISGSGSNVLNIFYRRRYCRVRLTTKLQLKQHFMPILWMFVMLLSQNIFNQADITMLGLMRSDNEVGLYSASIKIYTIVNQVITSVLWVVLPRLSVYYTEQNREQLSALLRKILGFITVLGLPCATGVFLLSEEVITIVGGETYQAAAPALRILMLALLFSLYGGGFLGNMIMLPSKRERYFMIACCITAFVNVVTNGIFIPYFGIRAAAATTALSELLLLIILALKIGKEVRIGGLRALFAAPLLGCVVIVASTLTICHFVPDLWIRTILSIACGAIGYGTVLLVCKNEITQLLLTTVKNKLFRR